MTFGEVFLSVVVVIMLIGNLLLMILGEESFAEYTIIFLLSALVLLEIIG